MKTWMGKQRENDGWTFAQLERAAWTMLLETFQQWMRELLEGLDQHVAAMRDTGRYVHKDRHARTVQTLVGPVTFRRRYYWDRETGSWVHLLDEALDLAREDRVGPGLAEQVVVWAAKGPSYRDARDRLADLYGQRLLSHESIRQILLEVAEATERREQNERMRSEGRRSVRALFVEVDGFYNALQGGWGRREAKAAILHEGWAWRQGRGKKTDYRLVHPSYFVQHDVSGEDFWEALRGHICARYRDVDKIPVIINGDGASWIAEGAAQFGWGLYQYDRFHLVRLLREALQTDPARWRKARAALAKNDVGTLATVVVEAWQAASDPDAKQRLDHLRVLLAERGEAVRDYRVRLQEMGFPVPGTWRSLGAAESHIDKFKNRTAKRGRAWSPTGLQAMLTCLGKLYEGVLHECVSRCAVELEAWVLERLKLGAGEVAAAVGSGWSPRQGGIPALRHGTQGFHEPLRSLTRVQPIY